ncbi:hypothetical protein EDD37DRAFT_612212 [Exophiala viscosa]|uniref:RING-type domain-containing protein n=1 Tax=Exophiala viscosa TaxID=2486360 RepID=A0AAN6DNR7_9EURO|nr:hypothetical protein EDD36DRAFT_78794 [Exophiala viscosa]KAI1620746.1 hypothetical protein EDD37DRAFT_612212 [Exophiala viscosa]
MWFFSRTSMSANNNETPVKKQLAASGSWEAFKISRPDLEPDDDWSRYPIPAELQTFEEYDALPEKLKQILVWSLTLTGRPVATKPPVATEPRSLSDSSGQVARNETCRPQTITTSLLSPDTSKSTGGEVDSETRSVYSAHAPSTSSSGHKTSSRPRLPMTGIVGSTLDLIAALKQKAEKDRSPAAVPKILKVPLVECTSCFDEFGKPDTARLPCTHSYCKPCLTTLITTALQNESSFPPKCCLTEIPLKTALLPLDSKQRETYKEKAAEYSIPPQERWYCPNAKCLKWIPPAKLHRHRNTNQKCPHCACALCSICRGQAHDRTSDCPQDYGLEATMSLADSEGWRRCYKCRTLVERSTGCRHMTCKCGAQFCYVCGVKWRTCHCTEVDEANRQADLARRRRDRQSALDDEAAEIAQAIADVEAVERQEAEERHRHRQEQEELDAQLAQLEQERLLEEAARREEAERLEREYEEMRRISVAEACADLQSTLDKLVDAQKQMLDNRHVRGERRFSQQRDEQITVQQKQNQELQSTMESNINKRTSLIERKHKSDIGVFTAEQDELEDDLFLEIQMHLHGKNDKEARERRLQEKFKKQRDEKYQELISKHKSESDALKANASMELSVLIRMNDEKMAKVRHTYLCELEAQVSVVAAERAWFKLITERRQNMLSANNRLMTEAVDVGEDPIGLIENGAAAIGPTLPERMPLSDSQNDGATMKQEPLVSSRTPLTPDSSAPSLVELAETSGSLVSGLTPQTPTSPSFNVDEQAAWSDPLRANSAWTWMTGTNEAQAGLSGISGPHQNPETCSPTADSQQLYLNNPQTRRPVSRRAVPVPLTSVHLPQRKPVPVPGSLQIRRPRRAPSMEGLQVAEPPNIPRVSRVPAIYFEDRDALPRTPGAFPVSPPKPRSPLDREITRVPSRRARPYSHSSMASWNSSSPTTISPISPPTEFSTPRTSVETTGHSRSPPELLPEVKPEEIQQVLSHHQSRVKRFFGGRSKTPLTDEEVKQRMRRNVGDAFY